MVSLIELSEVTEVRFAFSRFPHKMVEIQALIPAFTPGHFKL